MAKYVYKTPPPLEAIEWIGTNLKEIKVFLGKNFIKVNAECGIWFTQRSNGAGINVANLNRDVIVKDEDGNFWSERAEEFYDEWELAE